ncbi:MAG: YHYH protein [Bdellovibrionales bacterium]|nr:YHYH protein [Bdellovibrionales bacterium]
MKKAISGAFLVLFTLVLIPSAFAASKFLSVSDGDSLFTADTASDEEVSCLTKGDKTYAGFAKKSNTKFLTVQKQTKAKIARLKVKLNSASTSKAIKRFKKKIKQAKTDKKLHIAACTVSSMSLYSDAFKDTGSDYFNFPLSYTCDGALISGATVGGISPLLSWTGIPSEATHLILSMYTKDSEGNVTPQFTIFNILASTTSLPEGDLSIGTAAKGDMSDAEIEAAGGVAYSAPCAEGAGTTTLYSITLYALSGPLSLTESASRSEVLGAVSNLLLESKTLTVQRIRWDAESLANDLHVPTSVRSTCAEKEADFNEYSRVHSSISCDDESNEMIVISHIASGLKTELDEQQVQVGITRWIGRLSLPSQSGHTFKVTPTFLTGVNNNMACDGVDVLGITVDGQLILPYYKQTGAGGGSSDCGPTDGMDYYDRDTVVLGEVDQCYGHSPNGEGYHMHGAPVCLMDVHDPSKPIAYMSDGIPLYFGEGGGQITNTAHAIAVEDDGGFVTDLNYGGGRYEHLNFFPSDVKGGTNPLNDCNAYDINGDGAVSGYVYYTTKDAPYTIGCYMGEKLSVMGAPAGLENTNLVSARQGFTGQTLGDPMEGVVTSNTTTTFNDKNYNTTDFFVTDDSLAFLEEGKTAQVLWRVLDSSDDDYDPSTTCFEFRYRKDKDVTSSDETETICTERSVPTETLNFKPFD